MSGLVVGLLLAFVFKQNIVIKPKYEWEKEDYDPQSDLFMSHFDENGNFIEKTEEKSENLGTTYNYVFKENKED